MIVTLTPNPSLDRTIQVGALRVGEVNRANGGRVDAGGKGVNVSRALAANGSDTVAVLPAGGAAAVQFGSLLDDARVAYAFIDLPDAVRTNLTLVEDDGTTTKINEQGRLTSAEDVDAMLDAVEERCAGATWVVGSGSLPPGVGGELYAGLVERARRAGARVAIDSSGHALADAVRHQPDLIKPNQEELEELVGSRLDTVAEVLDAARNLVSGGVGTVVVSLGEYGAVAVDADGATHAHAVVAKPESTVGAGDCLLAGYLAATDSGAPRADALATGVRWGAAAVGLAGSRVPGPQDLKRVLVTRSSELPLDLKLNSHSALVGRSHKG